MTEQTSNQLSPEVRQRVVRMVLDHGGDHASQWSAIGSITARIGCMAETSRKWVQHSGPAQFDVIPASRTTSPHSAVSRTIRA